MQFWTQDRGQINIYVSILLGWTVSAVTTDRPIGASGFDSLKGWFLSLSLSLSLRKQTCYGEQLTFL